MRKRLIALALGTTASLLCAYLLYVGHHSRTIYRHLKVGYPILSGNVFEFDSELGYSPRPGSSGRVSFPVGPDVPVRYDSAGLRVPSDGASDAAPTHPLVLALGCSYTHADSCRAEESFTFLLGESLGGSSMNAGLSGYGLSQMLIRAREIIPEAAPDVVLVQYSQWLITRALSGFAPTEFVRRPTPFFVQTGEGRIELHPPAYRTNAFDYSLDEFKGTPSSVGELLAFTIKVGAPMTSGHHLQVVRFKLKTELGSIPRPAGDREAVIRSVYTEIRELCASAGARMVVVGVGNHAYPPLEEEVQVIREVTRAPYVDTWEALLEQVPDGADQESYLREFAHWRGSPPQLVDRHPNARAHRVMAQAIQSALTD